jgi:pimeloyl-ACP methyl ester carboxylesterase
MALPQTRYVRSTGGVHLAYQVVGDGPIDLVLVSESLSHLELRWEEPSLARSLRQLASFSRLIMFDKRGTGLSDPVPMTGLPTMEQRVDDIRAVVAEVGAEQVAVMGTSEGGAETMLLAATYPELVSSLVSMPPGPGSSWRTVTRSGICASRWSRRCGRCQTTGDRAPCWAWWHRRRRMTRALGCGGASSNGPRRVLAQRPRCSPSPSRQTSATFSRRYGYPPW